MAAGPDRPPARAALPVPLRPPLALVAVLSALVVGALGLRYAGHTAPGAVDSWIFPPTSDSVRAPWRQVALVLDFLGEPVGSVLVIAAGVAGCLVLRRPRAAVLVLAGAGVTVGTTTLLKHVVGRTIHGPGNLSYPSGHTAFATALALMAALVATDRLGLGRTAGTSLVLAAGLVAGAVMGWAEVGLGAHYPTDALGGWCTALAVVPATAWLVDRAADRLGSGTAVRTGGRPPGRTAGTGRRERG
ncbi:phosphatase PAP2 family protein [Streptomyces sp. NPDC101175]|uniref:phosphatase PAP2 family protein n=1 Tax=Streptomyces sp. NPDC101175 TaxID=3366123 RepID=UPI00383248B7